MCPQKVFVKERSHNSRTEATREILELFLRSPEMADSFHGIARWRVLQEAVQRNIAATESALNWLIKEGFLIEETIAGSQSVFRLNMEKKSEAEQLVEGDEDLKE